MDDFFLNAIIYPEQKLPILHNNKSVSLNQSLETTMFASTGHSV